MTKTEKQTKKMLIIKKIKEVENIIFNLFFKFIQVIFYLKVTLLLPVNDNY
jgi:hypothetical protein